MNRAKVLGFCAEASNRPNLFTTFTFDEELFGHLVAHIKESVYVNVLEKLLPEGLHFSEIARDTYSISGANSKFYNPMKVFSMAFIVHTEKISLRIRIRFGANEVIECFRGYGESDFVKIGELVARRSFSMDYFDFMNAKFEHTGYYSVQILGSDEPNFKIEDMWLK